jgi:C4-dicarboxylate-specific signal transduction histidine kinase
LVGVQYLDACRRGVATSAETAGKALDLVESVLDGGRSGGTIEYASIRGHEERWFELRVEPLGDPGQGAAIMRFDITARKHDQAEARRHLDEIAHVNRVAALGELAASLAHELNQPLTAILTNAQAAQRLLSGNSPDLEEFRECLADIVTSDRRAGEVIRGMRGLLKKGTFEPVPLDLGQIGQSVVNLVSSDALLLQVSIEVATAPALPVVEGDAVQIQQVVLNLLLNAISAAALAPVGQRKVIVRTVATESYVELSVHDSGPGIAVRDLDRIFEPFFTTKHDGLGMGLTISRSIIQAHGGKIWAENEPPGGATFRMRLPTKGERLL